MSSEPLVDVDITDPITGVRYVQIQPRNGWVYSCFVTPLPANVEGGAKETHDLVSVRWPYGSAAYVFAKGGHLLAYYVIDKLGLESVNSDHHRPIVDLVRYSLGRPA